MSQPIKTYTRRDLLKLCGAGAATIAISAMPFARNALAEGGAAGTNGGTAGGQIWQQVFWFSVWFDEGGFVNGNMQSTQGWEEDSANYFWNHFVAPECRRLTGQDPRSDHGSIDWSGRTPYQVYMDEAKKACNLARNRGGTQARVVGVGGFIMSTTLGVWQFASATGFSSYNMTYSRYFPRVPNASELKGAGWDADSQYAGGNAGEDWRHFIYRRAHGDLGDAEYSVIVIAVNDDEPVPMARVRIHKSSTRPEVSNASSYYTLAGAVYDVYSDQNCTQHAKDINGNNATLGPTNASGYSDYVELLYGTYYLKERTAPHGFFLDEEHRQVTLEPGDERTEEVEEVPMTGYIETRKELDI